ncbi:hypothetical protein [Candidatus Sarmatiella mevalonica]|uniref:hypothetical protein n=1 Tax=Candidatus Sarmatiella mevalonica TaxID=2770581 RepID=UPI001922FF9D|nr:hypothetical protein [Candidatus Sarmatiella mevalonica]
MKYVRTCASTASPRLPSGAELGKRSIKSFNRFLYALFTITDLSTDCLRCSGIRV